MVNYFELEKWLIADSWYWPEDQFMTFGSKIKIGFNTLVIFISIWGEITFAYHSRDNLPVALNAICPVVSKLMLLSKVLILHNYRKELKETLLVFKDKMDEGNNHKRKSFY